MPDWKRLICQGDTDAILAAIAVRWAVSVDIDIFLNECVNCGSYWGDPSWSDATWEMWIKHRLCKIEAFPVGGMSEEPTPKSCRLHIGFVSVYEDDHMLYLLSTERFWRKMEEYARSGVSKSLRQIHPINVVSARVAPEPPGWDQGWTSPDLKPIVLRDRE